MLPKAVEPLFISKIGPQLTPYIFPLFYNGVVQFLRREYMSFELIKEYYEPWDMDRVWVPLTQPFPYHNLAIMKALKAYLSPKPQDLLSIIMFLSKVLSLKKF